MSDNSSWWLLLPCGIVTVALATAITVTVVVIRKVARPAPPTFHDARGSGATTAAGPLGPDWVPGGSAVAGLPESSSPAPAHEPGHQHGPSHGHTIHHHHDSGSASSWSDSGSGDSGSSSSSHHHHSD